MADTTATTRLPACLRAMRRLATIWMRSGEATDVPPNLHTIKDMAFSLTANDPRAPWPNESSLYQNNPSPIERSPPAGSFSTGKVRRGRRAAYWSSLNPDSPSLPKR